VEAVRTLIQRLTLAAAVLLGAAAPSFAVTHYATSVAPYTYAQALNVNTPCTLPVANANAIPGDTIRLLPADFSAQGQDIAPAASGTSGQRIVYLGYSADTVSAVVRNITLGGKSYITVKWVRATGSAGPNSATASRSDSITDCRILGSLEFGGSHDFVGRNLRVGRSGTHGNSLIAHGQDLGGVQTWRPRLENVTAYVGGWSGSIAGNNAFKLSKVFGPTWSDVYVEMYATGADGTVQSEFNWLIGGSFTRLNVRSINKTTGGDNPVVIFFRDSTQHNTFTDCSFVMDPASTKHGRMDLSGSGDPNYATPYSQYDNQFIGCLFNIDGLFRYQYYGRRYVFDHCIMKVPQLYLGEAADSLTVDHCTLYASGGREAIQLDKAGLAWSKLTFTNNIVYKVGGSPYALADMLTTGTGNVIGNNLYYSTTLADSTKAVRTNGGNSRVGPSVAWCSSSGFDCQSRFGNPGFTNPAAGDFTVSPTGNAVGAWWPDGYVGAVAPAGADPCLEADRPGKVVDLVAVDAGGGYASVRSTLPGETQFSGDGCNTIIHVHRSPSPILTDLQFNAATDLTDGGTVCDMAPPGTFSEFYADPVPASGVWWYAAKFENTLTGKWSCLSNTDSVSITAPDVTPPATPFVTASLWREDGVRVVFVAPGNDGSSGRAASYDVRFRTDPGISFSTWDDQGVQSQTYRVTGEGAPRASGSSDTVYVYGLRPGRVYWFAMTATDSTGNVSGISNADSVAIPARPFAEIEHPAFGSYSGAGFAETEPVIRPWSVLVGNDGAAVNDAELEYVARFPVISLEPAFADSAGPYGKLVSLAAIQRGRALNPKAKWLAEPVPDASYRRVGPDTANVFSYRFQQWRAARDAGGGWTTGGGFLWDYISPTCFHQTRASGCVAGNTLLNTNLAWQPSPGRWPVADSLVAVYTRHFITRRQPDGTYVWDGIMTDLNSPDIFSEINLNWSRAGYPDSASLDTAWVAAKAYFMRELRAAAVRAGRPDFIITGNGVSGRAYDQANGWMREGWPGQQGGTWTSNLLWTPGGQLADWYGFSAWQPAVSWLFAFTCATGDSCAGFNPDSVGARQTLRYVQGTAALTGAVAVYEPSKAALAQGGGYHRYWFDEWAADTSTGQCVRDAALEGWLGRPTSQPYVTAPAIYSGGDKLQGIGGFEVGTLGSAWSWGFSGGSGQASYAVVNDTVATGTYALRIRIGTKQVADWSASLNGNVFGYATIGQTVVLSFKARSSNGRPVQAHIVNKPGSGSLPRASWSNLSRSWISPTGWTQYRLVGTATATDSITAAFWCGDTSGTVWIDDVQLHVGGARGGSWVRQFQRGVVVVNPQTYADTITFGRATRRLTTQAGKNPDVNNGALQLGGTSIVVPAKDARFLLWAGDSIRPATPTIAAGVTGRTWAQISIPSAVGDDSLSGAVQTLQVRIRTDGVAVSDANWSTSTVAAASYPLVNGGQPQIVTLNGLAPGTAYRIGIRAQDEAGWTSPTSNSVTLTTTSSAVLAVHEGK